jgi:tetratricopeptide (TPR) repeat protein
MPLPAPIRRSFPVLCAIAIAGFAVGCASSGSEGGVDASSGQQASAKGYEGKAADAMMAEYSAGRYSAAYRAAKDAMGELEGRDKERAMLIAGLSAQAMGQRSDAEFWFRQVERSTDTEIAGRARAGMGLLALNAGDYTRAAAMLSTASAQLKGDESARASLFAGQAYEAMGRLDRARTQYLVAMGLAESPALRSNVQAALSSLGERGFTVQLGAFASRVNADRAARQYRDHAASLNMGEPRIVERRGVGGSGDGVLFLVQVGSYKSQQDADKARLALATTLGEKQGPAGVLRPFVAPAFASVNE